MRRPAVLHTSPPHPAKQGTVGRGLAVGEKHLQSVPGGSWVPVFSGTPSKDFSIKQVI